MTELMYKVGDEVLIRKDIRDLGDDGVFDDSVGYNDDMGDYAESIAVINCIGKTGNGHYYYRISVDSGEWMWVDDMFDHKYKEMKPMEKEKTYEPVEHKAVKEINRIKVKNRMLDTLEICQIYHPTDAGMNAVLDKWEDAKGRTDIWKGHSVLDILSKHPDYVPEKGYIVKKNEYDRGVDANVINEVLGSIEYITENPFGNGLIDEVDIKPWSYMECKIYKEKLNEILTAMSYDDQLMYRGMTAKQVRKERDEWDNRLEILTEKYAIINNRCFNIDDRKKINRINRLIGNIRLHVLEQIKNLTEDELLQPLVIDETIMDYIENSELTIRGIRVGQKFNKVINKILTETGIKDRWTAYNRQSARLGDASSPTKFTRFTIISANPVDFWRMSFGSSWKSCHTIDKEGYYRPSDGGDGYEGMHASGCSSYMLDPSSVVMYTVDKSYEGNDYELEPKINRCMFHIGEEKFVMGRVYPQGTDGEEEVYRQWRQIFQTIIAECMDMPNYWKTCKDRGEKFEQIRSHGTHYRDYEMGYCDIAGWSYLKPDVDALPSSKRIDIGATPICPCCGAEHWVEDNIECEDCNGDNEKECAECGCVTDREYMHEINGYWYCEDCCFYCEYHGEWEVGESYYVDGYGDVCEYALDSGDFAKCDECGEYTYVGGYADDGITTEDGNWYCSKHCAENAGYVLCEDDCWHYADDDNIHFCEECETWVLDDNWDDDEDMCMNCVNSRRDRETA